MHSLPDGSKIAVYLRALVQCEFVAQHQTDTDRAVSRAVFQQLLSASEHEGNADLIYYRLAKLYFLEDKTAADRIVGLAVNAVITCVRVDAQPVFVPRHVSMVKHYVPSRAKSTSMGSTGQHQPLALGDAAQERRRSVYSHRIWAIADQAKDDRLVSVVSLSRSG